MTFAGTTTILLGIIIFLIGYWYFGKSMGQYDCKEKPENTTMNYGGGIAGIVIGIILMLTGLIMNFTSQSSSTTETITDQTISYDDSTPSV